jgi:HEAT repeat protein
MMALGKLQDDRGVVPIASRLLVPEDRREASAALQALGPKAETEVLKGLQTPDKDLLLELLKILKVIGTKASVKPLKYVAQVAVQLKQRDVAEAALLALQEVGKR